MSLPIHGKAVPWVKLDRYEYPHHEAADRKRTKDHCKYLLVYLNMERYFPWLH